mmetsp:Transcript_16529/g.39678  ORF Transcript_16529/g.39678 Transcript_16529/m.39678 type:complete len:232 (-) Transcript_16529:279-974(-)
MQPRHQPASQPAMFVCMCCVVLAFSPLGCRLLLCSHSQPANQDRQTDKMRRACELAPILLELPLAVAEWADVPCLEPPGDAVEVEGVVAHAPRHCALLARLRTLVGLALDAGVHDVIAADGTVVHNDVPGPECDGVPLLDLEPLLALLRLVGGTACRCCRCRFCHRQYQPSYTRARRETASKSLVALAQWNASQLSYRVHYAAGAQVQQRQVPVLRMSSLAAPYCPHSLLP